MDGKRRRKLSKLNVLWSYCVPIEILVSGRKSRTPTHNLRINPSARGRKGERETSDEAFDEMLGRAHPSTSSCDDSKSRRSSKIGFFENIEKGGIIQNGAEVDGNERGPPTHAVRAREGTRVTLCRVFVRPATTRTTGIHLDDEIYELARETNIN